MSEPDEWAITSEILARIEELATEAAAAPNDFRRVEALAEATLRCVREIRRLRVDVGGDLLAETKVRGELGVACDSVRLVLKLLQTLYELEGNKTIRPTTWRVLLSQGDSRVQAFWSWAEKARFDETGTPSELADKLTHHWQANRRF